MENRVWRIFLCCFICAGIGTLISLEVNKYFWWAGVLTGGFLGYLSYDFKKVILTIPKAWQVTKGCKIDWNKICIVVSGVGSVSNFSISCFGFSLNISVPLLTLSYCQMPTVTVEKLLIMQTLIFLLTVLVSLEGMHFVTYSEKLIPSINELGKSLRKINFFRVYFYLLPRGIFWCAKKTPRAVIITAKGIGTGSVILAKFIKYLFILIHSEWRLLCATDSAIGALIGYLCGNIAIGALAGGVIGVLNYEIVSKRILKLKIVSK